MEAFNVEQITESIYRIDERGYSNCYLVIGNEKAILIDTCGGCGNLRELVESITNLPVIVALTHRHPDHAGGCGWYDKFYAGEGDVNSMNKRMTSKAACFAFAKYCKVKNMRTEKFPYRPECIDIQDGYTFELGGRTIIAISTPGHTPGSMVFLDDKEHYIFTGDEVGKGIWLWLPDSLSIEEWLKGAMVIRGYVKEGYTPLTGHENGRTDLDTIEALMRLAQRLMRKYAHGEIKKNITVYTGKEGISITCRCKNNV